MAKTISLIRGNVVTPKKVIYGGFVLVVDGIIEGVGGRAYLPSKEDLQQKYGEINLEVTEEDFILPGFVDIHNHGLGGADDVIGHWSNPEFSLKELARCGTLCTLASIIFSEDHKDLVAKCIKEVESRVNRYIPDCATLGGIHAEGPVIHDRGGLPSCNSRWTLEQFKKLCTTMPSMRVMTISPHIDASSNYELIKHLLHIGVRPSLGHDRVATKKDILGALKLATTEEERFHVTHMHNVMSFHHRNASLINVSLCSTFPDADIYKGALPPTVEIIADLVHVDAIPVQATISARGCDDIAAITDCISEHRPGKRLKYNGRLSVVRAEGGCYLCDALGRPSKTLAGSTSCLSDLFMNLVSLFRVNLVSACKMVATTPAKIARLNGVGSIEKGKQANLLLLNSDLDTIKKRMIYGKWTSHGEYRLLRPAVSHM
ncbi:putative N-acetylglucosamine-6-phosphate deacetylase-like protein [Trypanosoma theileri]|uniref:Putative N-acetylglucosamine-6-phosphate deacetylase-like protein n=1 Tax=Trypanosoma theileri TaxID=67003 RepID=A0A1X0NNC6_9TRYP|nr:putative N-acetylglucosamine-6-phosphate deacetylase-like protein [Trypanosoma theileri]ORC86214.1 putative N-acetylglucosamine-6-phosphate deacetylase-like protein [Trypanosoma theileri]